MSSDNKARTHRIVKLWCDKCRAEMVIKTKHEHEAKFCPMCKEKTLTESIRYD